MCINSSQHHSRGKQQAVQTLSRTIGFCILSGHLEKSEGQAIRSRDIWATAPGHIPSFVRLFMDYLHYFHLLLAGRDGWED